MTLERSRAALLSASVANKSAGLLVKLVRALIDRQVRGDERERREDHAEADGQDNLWRR